MELATYTVRRILNGDGRVALYHIDYFGKGIPVVDFVTDLLVACESFTLPEGFTESFVKVQTVPSLEYRILYWADYCENFNG